MTDLDALWAAVADRPADDGLKLILADAGDEAAERALRWCVANGRWPEANGNLFIPPHQTWGWCGDAGIDEFYPNDSISRLPNRLWRWFMKGEPLPTVLGPLLSPFPLCRDDDLRVVVRRLGEALATAD